MAREPEEAGVGVSKELERLRARVAELEASGAVAVRTGDADSEGFFRAIVDHAPVGAVVADTRLDGTMHYVNDAFTHITGYTLGELPRVRDWVESAYPDPDYRTEVLSHWADDVASENQGRPVVYRIVRKDGRQRSIQFRSGLLNGSKMIVTLLDVTDRIEAEQSLKESEQRYRALIDTTPIATVVHSEGRIVFANEAAVQIFGGSRAEDLLGKPIMDFVHPDSREAVATRIRSLYEKTGRAPMLEEKLLRLDGGVVYAEVTAAPVDFLGRPASLVAAHDISERRRAAEQRELLEMQVRHAQKLESLGLLAGGVAHDFNNLLLGILGNADLARLDIPDSSPAADRLTAIESAAERAAELAQQMLAYSGKGVFVVERIALNDVVRGIADLLEVSIPKKAAFDVLLTEALPMIEADATQVQQVVMNLVTNAAEALVEGSGRIVLRTGVAECDRGRLDRAYGDEGLAEGDYVFVEVDDSGIGMEPDTLDRIFDPFFSTKFTGRGLGLAAVLGIARGHGGAVEVQTTPGGGACFRVLFPSTEGRAPIAVPPETEPGEWQGEGTVLLVDDDETVREVAALMLRRCGFDVVEAVNGAHALEVFQGHAEDVCCVLLDLTMPEMDGVETFRELRKLRADIPVVLSSGFNEQDVIDRFGDERPALFIQKPYRRKTLRAALRRLLEA